MFRSRKQYWLNIIATLVVAAGLTISVSPPPAQAQGNPNPGIVPNGPKYEKLSALWWQWLFSIPAATNPGDDTTGANCAQSQGIFGGNVWFLSGTSGGSATRSCAIPPGQFLFFPIVTVVTGSGVFDCDPTSPGSPGVPCDVATLRAIAASFADNPLLLEASIDGRPLQNLSDYRAQSPVFSITTPADSITGFSGTFTPQVADGYYLLVTPLSPGAHTIRFRGIFNDGFDSEVTYFLTVGN